MRIHVLCNVGPESSLVRDAVMLCTTGRLRSSKMERLMLCEPFGARLVETLIGRSGKEQCCARTRRRPRAPLVGRSVFLCEGLLTSKVRRCAPMGNIFHFCVETRKSVRSPPPRQCVFLEHRTGSCIPFNSARVLLVGTQYRHVPRPSSPSRGRSTPANLGRYILALESIATSSLHNAFRSVSSPAPPLQGRIGLFHRRAVTPHRPVQASPSSRTSSRSCTSSRLRPVQARPPATVCGPPFVMKNFIYASATSTCTLAWGGSLPRRHSPSTTQSGLAGRRFSAFYVFWGLPVDSGGATIGPRESNPHQRYRCDDYLIKISFSWLLRSSQGPFLHRIRECVQQNGAQVREGQMSKGERAPCAARQGHSLPFPTV